MASSETGQDFADYKLTRTSKAGARALALMDKLLAERPEKVGHDFSSCTRCLTQFRDELVAAVRQGGGGRERLEAVNTLISIVMAGHFPLGPIPWDHIEMARGKLAELVTGPAVSSA